MFDWSAVAHYLEPSMHDMLEVVTLWVELEKSGSLASMGKSPLWGTIDARLTRICPHVDLNNPDLRVGTTMNGVLLCSSPHLSSFVQTFNLL